MKTTASVAAAVLVLVFALSYSKPAPQNVNKRYVVKLYSGEKVIARWTSANLGTVDGTSLVFTSVQGYDETKLQVRINGRYTVEELVQ